MRVQVTALKVPKGEHTDDTNEDALGLNPGRGLFAVADGVGTAAYSNVWSELIVNHLLAEPLLSQDPFEVEWWLRRVQPEFMKKLRSTIPNLDSFPLAAQESIRKGSHTTLVALRVVSIADETIATVALAFGDSCLLALPKDGAFSSFPLTRADQFYRSPVCLPSRPMVFDRDFHRCQMEEFEFRAGDQVILATDAVSKWVIGSGEGCAEAFRRVAAIRDAEAWKQFIEERRAKGEMVDDDCTALILQFLPEAEDPAAESGTEANPPPASAPPRPAEASGELLNVHLVGTTTRPAEELMRLRQEEFGRALEKGDAVLQAIAFGDGTMMTSEIRDRWGRHQQRWREKARALTEVLQTLQDALRGPEEARLQRLTPVWRKRASLLRNEPAAKGLRESLARLGVPMPPPSPRDLAQDAFEEAVRADEDEAILNRLDEWRQLLPELTAEQAERVKRAKEREQLRRQLSSELKEAIQAEDDPDIVRLAEELKELQVELAATDQKRVAEARQREASYRRIKDQLAAPLPDLSSDLSADCGGYDRLLSPDDKKQIRHWMALRRHWQMSAAHPEEPPEAVFAVVFALDRDDDRAIARAAESLGQGALQNPVLRERVALAKDRERVCDELAQYLRDGNDPAVTELYDRHKDLLADCARFKQELAESTRHARVRSEKLGRLGQMVRNHSEVREGMKSFLQEYERADAHAREALCASLSLLREGLEAGMPADQLSKHLPPQEPQDRAGVGAALRRVFGGKKRGS